MKMEHKTMSFRVDRVELKDSTTGNTGIDLGVFEGHLAAFAIDEDEDKFLPGAFLESIQEHKRRDERPIRMFLQHQRKLIGGFPIEFVREDDKGLFVRGEINLDTTEGPGAFSLMRQGVLRDMSIGFAIPEGGQDFRDGVRHISRAIIREGSLVDEPANRAAQITLIKSVSDYRDLPIDDSGKEWVGLDAATRLIDSTGSKDKPSPRYREAFLWIDKAIPEAFDAYHLPIADVIDGKLVAMPGAIRDAAKNLDKIPEEDRAAVKDNLERYFSKMGEASPFKPAVITKTELLELTTRQLEDALLKTSKFSKEACKTIVSRFASKKKVDNDEDEGQVVSLIQKLTTQVKSLREDLKA